MEETKVNVMVVGVLKVVAAAVAVVEKQVEKSREKKE